MDEAEVRAAALEAAARVYEGRGTTPYNVIYQAQRYEHYLLTGKNE